MRCDTYEQLIGKRLQERIMNANGVMLFPEGWILTAEDVEKIKLFRIDLYDILVEEVKRAAADEQAVETGQALSVTTDRDRTQEVVQHSEAHYQQIESAILKTGKVPVKDVEQFMPTLTRSTRNRNVFRLFNELKAGNDGRYKHSLEITMISTLIGRWLGMDDDELERLAMAASLCDIGMIKLPSAIVEKTTLLEPHEMEIMKQHTTFGYELLCESNVDPRVAKVALQHHEREDGSGYPSGLRAPEIDRFSKIVALADVYVEMTSEKPHAPAKPFYEVIHELHDQVISGRFDQEIGMTFLHRLMSSQVGSDVVLSDERTGRIVLIDRNYPARPIVAVGDEIIDLSRTEDLRIKAIIG